MGLLFQGLLLFGGGSDAPGSAWLDDFFMRFRARVYLGVLVQGLLEAGQVDPV